MKQSLYLGVPVVSIAVLLVGAPTPALTQQDSAIRAAT
jgi:hypothetical protein